MAKNRSGNRDGRIGVMAQEAPQEPSVDPISGDSGPGIKPPKSAPAKPGPPTITVHVEIIWGGITNVKIPVAIGPHYQGLPLAGPARAFDRLLDCWLTRSIDLGMIASGLGQLVPINLQRRYQAGEINAEILLMVGAGEPGQFAQDDLRY